MRFVVFCYSAVPLVFCCSVSVPCFVVPLCPMICCPMFWRFLFSGMPKGGDVTNYLRSTGFLKEIPSSRNTRFFIWNTRCFKNMWQWYYIRGYCLFSLGFSCLSLQTYSKKLGHRCFPVNFVKLLRTQFLQNNSGWLFWNTFFRYREVAWKTCEPSSFCSGDTLCNTGTKGVEILDCYFPQIRSTLKIETQASLEPIWTSTTERFSQKKSTA